jgi:hypothetical protein
MTTVLTLHLPDSLTIAQVQALPGLHDLPLDADYGLVCISPRTAEYVVRTSAPVTNLNERRRQSPEILEAYGDVRIEPFNSLPP